MSTSARDSLNAFIEDVGAPEGIKTDSAAEFTGRNSEFAKLCRKRSIRQTFQEAGRSNQIPHVDVQIRELRKRWQHLMITKKVPRRMWCYGLRYIAKLSQFIPQRADGRTGYEVVTGRTPDISEYCDFAFWDLVWYHTRTAANMSKTSRALGRWSGISHRVGSDMCYWVMPVSGQMISETTVQHVTRYDLENAEIAAAVEEFNGALTTRLDDTNFWLSNDHGVYIDDFDVQPDAAYGDEADTPTTNEYGGVEYEEVNDADIDSYDKFLGAKIRLSNDSNNGANMATVVARATDYAGRPIGKAHSNPLLDGRLYEVELDDGTTDRVDPDVYRRKSVKPNGEPYYELLLVYVDDILLVSAKPGEVFKQIASQFTIKDDHWGPPTQFLGSEVEEFIFEDGGRAWSTTCHKYVKNAVDTVKQLLREDGRQFKSSKRCEGPLPVDYRPELDTTDELPPDLVSRFQQLIGIGSTRRRLGMGI
ncbi:predicted protein [Thalassiosira pseudonana CCMP1335]|uniref:Integrase catalytic domain-containing protein n=1 Tax=Thalassiosira pseudonana TaxID=35128 RepID=B5YNX3_THAPS|nr:predicted protein [Thalassiosira pseudonana CCMP1335]ACI64709.1 predicted protein [Thalassiosira pseudonana CCMP1335]